MPGYYAIHLTIFRILLLLLLLMMVVVVVLPPVVVLLVDEEPGLVGVAKSTHSSVAFPPGHC